MSEDVGTKKRNMQLLLARSSWIATIIAIVGNRFMYFIAASSDGHVVAPCLGWVCHLLCLSQFLVPYGAVVGLYAIVRGLSHEHRKCLKHGIIGACINIALIVFAIYVVMILQLG